MNLPASDNTYETKRLAIFASGSGSNAQKIIEHFLHHPFIKISLIVCNVPTAGVIQRAGLYNVSVLLINKEEFISGDSYVPALKEAKIDFIVLAGFLWKVPEALI